MKYIIISLFFFITILFCGNIHAQDYVRAYASARDYKAGKADILSKVRISTKRSNHDPSEPPYYIVTADWKLNPRIQNKYWAIERNDSLFVNCTVILAIDARLKPSHNSVVHTVRFVPGSYSLVLFRSPKYLYFRAGRSNVQGVPLYIPPTSLMDAIEREEEANERFPYLYDFTLNKVIYFNRGIMRNYVSNAIIPEDTAFIRYVNALIKTEP